MMVLHVPFKSECLAWLQGILFFFGVIFSTKAYALVERFGGIPRTPNHL